MSNTDLKPYTLSTESQQPVTIGNVQDQISNLKGEIVLQEGKIQSANFQTGVQGWQINKKGNAEFNNGTFRGTFNLGNTQITVNSVSEIQTAINTVSAAGGGIVYLAAGTYTLTSAITMKSNVSLIGSGAGITILDGILGSGYLSCVGSSVYTTGTVAITNGGTTVTGTGTTFTSGMVGQHIRLGDFWYLITTFTSTTEISIDSTTVYSGLTLTTEATLIATIIEDISIKDFSIINVLTTNAITINYGNNIIVDSIYANEITDGFNNAAVAVFNSSRIFIYNQYIDNCDYGVSLNNTRYAEVNSINTSNTLVAGVEFKNACKNINCDQVNVSTTTTGSGLRILDSENMTVSSFSSNNTYTSGINLTNCTNIVICNGSINTTTFTGQSGINLSAGGNSNIIITGNNVINCTGRGINNGATTNNDIVIANNYLFNNSLGAITDTGVRTVIRGNSGGSDGIIDNPKTSRLTTQFDAVTTTTLTGITGISCSLIAGRVYTFRLKLFVNSSAAGGLKFDMGGGTATATSYVASILVTNDTTNTIYIANRLATLTSGFGGTGPTSSTCDIQGTIVVNTAGTFIPRFAQQVANGTSSILVNSTLVVEECN